MSIIVKAAHINITGALREYAEKKAAKVLDFFDGVQEIAIELDIVDSSHENDRQVVSATAKGPHVTFRAECASFDMYASVDQVMDKLIVQVKKYRDKQRDHHPPSPKIKRTRTTLTRADHADELDRHYAPKPMDVEDAVDEWALRGTPFLMFRNAKTGEINVVYGLGQQQVGHIEP